ncbi:MAG: VWA domain-containing protein [Candidatus Kapaibacterium sp.]|nr:MAG: VWA domain-containing protein [Candidatus Kapabacteria bacterium]
MNSFNSPKQGSMLPCSNQSIQNTVKTPPAQKVQPLSAVLTIDISGSMSWGKGKFTNLQLAQQAASAFVRALQLPPSECAVTSFNGISFINQDFTADRASLLAAINALQPDDGTHYMEGLLNEPASGIPIAKAGRNKRVVIFLTNGLGDGDEEAIVKAAKDKTIEIYCVAVGLPAPSLLRNIARRTGGVCFENVNDFVRITHVYQAIVQLAQGRTPCEFTWRSDAPCDTEENTLTARLQNEADSLATNLSYLSRIYIQNVA